MTPLAAALLGTFLGVLVGAAVTVAIVRRPVAAHEPPVVRRDEIPAIVEALPSGVAMIGSQDDVVATNESAERLGLVRGSRVIVPAVLDMVRLARRDGKSSKVDIEQAGRLGRPPAHLRVRIVPLEAGRIFLVADDRTADLRAAESSRDFMTNATHELKTPIGAIALLSEAAEGAADDPDAVARFAGKIRTEAGRLTELVQQIITLSRLQGRGALGSARRIRVEDVIADAVNRCGQLAAAREVTLTVSGTCDDWVFGDADQLATALANLIGNAINYSDLKSRVVISTRGVRDADDEDWVDIGVSDNGIGIAPEDQQRIFERFYRVDYARSRETGGTGLGLSIVSEIAQGHGGTITVWSKVGAGSTFTLRLPAHVLDGENDSEGEES